eukprot:TRINITY_DN121415_c0_g1_i1.p1 TRINITY_DN121415_c0_g1~~TRINITY_DN121415_c0_g1_i1.p1  ORF type:complete len:685 (+),score=123.33 TRINITY_DN121415_c0_g1_i1:118-2172(+)
MAGLAFTAMRGAVPAPLGGWTGLPAQTVLPQGLASHAFHGASSVADTIGGATQKARSSGTWTGPSAAQSATATTTAVATAALTVALRRALRRSTRAPGVGEKPFSVWGRTSCRCVATAEASVSTEQASATAATPSSASGLQSKKPALRLDKVDDAVRRLTVTTPLFYANGPPHIGTIYPTIAADVLARYSKMHGANVNFTTGMDEHGEKIAQTASKQDLTAQELVDKIAGKFSSLWQNLDMMPDHHFVRTTAPQHREIVNEFWQRCLDNDDIYRKGYTGQYCVGCEAYLDADEMDGDICKIHQRPVETRTEENYFFRLSKYWDQVVAHVKENPDFILPVGRRNEILGYLKEDNKRDFSISRASTKWGIPTPGDDSQVIYVWFDALLGYMSSLLESGSPASIDAAVARGWPADVHVIGKDILRFHCIYWPAMLMSAGLPLPKHICTHGFLTKDGLKMGKSLGNVVDPVELVDAFGADAVRYFFSSRLSFGEDSDFSYGNFISEVNAALANELGNLCHRVLSLCKKNLPEQASARSFGNLPEEELKEHPVYKAALAAKDNAAANYERLDYVKAAEAALSVAGAANTHIMGVAPWKLLKGSEEEVNEALQQLIIYAEGVRVCAVLLSPITPQLSRTILKELGLDDAAQLTWEDATWNWDLALPGLVKGTAKPVPVFARIDPEPWKGK